MAGALDGITVLDMSHGMAGAMATMFMCDNGAKVVRIDDPSRADLRRDPGYMVWDRGKKSVFLDLWPGPEAADLDNFHRLVRRADALVESYAPSSPLQSVVDYDKLSSMNPGLVHTSITAYGKSGPLKDEPAIDDLVVARVGILDTTPGFRPGPPHLVHPVASVGAALLAAMGTVAALFARERTGRGRKVDTSLMAGALIFAPKVTAEKMASRRYTGQPAGGGPFYSVMECADGQWVQLGCVHQGFIDLAAGVMDLADVIKETKFGGGHTPESEEARQELFDIVAVVIGTKTYEEWAEIFEEADVPYARICEIEEAFDNPQVRVNQMVTEVDDPVVGRVMQMGVPIHLSETLAAIKGPRPVPGHHTDEVLSQLKEAGPGEDIPPTTGDGDLLDPPLLGVKVLEFTNVLAGPTVGKLWSDLGADVIKLESLNGDISRPGLSFGFVYLNSNKRSISVDAKTSEGREVTRRLAAQADILLANMRPGAAERMGVGNDVLKELNPDIIETHVTAFGWDGPYAHRAGVDPLAQAWTGMQRAQGGHGNPPVFLGGLAPTDYTGGALGALGGVMALLARERTGTAQRVNTNLLNAAILLSSHAFLGYEEKPPRRLADKGQYGLGALHRLYETSEGWLYLVAENDGEWPALCRALDRDDLADDVRFASAQARRANDAALADTLSQLFRGQSRDEWVEGLSRAGVPCAPVVEEYAKSFYSDPQAIANDMVGSRGHVSLGKMKYGRNLVRFGRTPDVPGRPTPLLGEQTREVLEGAGYTEAEVDRLYEMGVVKTRTPSEERPGA